ncbi:MAG: hypothetical protein ACR2RV_05530, partial [Verrucomicrobiales bacterium]
PGAKAGGPNYVFNFATWQANSLPELREAPNFVTNKLLSQFKRLIVEGDVRERLQVGAWSFGWALEHEFEATHDPSQLHGEANVFRYCPRKRLLLRCDDSVELCDVMMAILAATACELEGEISLAAKHAKVIQPAMEEIVTLRIVEETPEALVARLGDLDPVPEILRYLGEVPGAIHERANGWHIPVVDDPVLSVGRLELRYYFREQSTSETLHRYGNLIDPPPTEWV